MGGFISAFLNAYVNVRINISNKILSKYFCCDIVELNIRNGGNKMKKSLTKLLIIAIICLIVTCIFSSLAMKVEFAYTKQVGEEFNEMGTGNPGSGWYLLIGGGTALLADFAVALLYIIILGIPVVILFFILVSQLVARLVQIGEEKEGKNTTSKVFTIISIVLQIILCVYQLFIIICEFEINKILLSLALILNITSVVLFIKELRNMKKLNTEIKAEVIEEK